MILKSVRLVFGSLCSPTAVDSHVAVNLSVFCTARLGAPMGVHTPPFVRALYGSQGRRRSLPQEHGCITFLTDHPPIYRSRPEWKTEALASIEQLSFPAGTIHSQSPVSPPPRKSQHQHHLSCSHCACCKGCCARRSRVAAAAV